MSATSRQKVISGDSTKTNSTESFVASRILTASPDQSPAACRIRQLTKELEAANRKCSQWEEEVRKLESAIKDLNYEHTFKLEKQAFTIGRQLKEKDAEIEQLTSNHKSVIEAKESEITALKSSYARELKDVREAKDTEIASVKRETEALRIAKDAEISDLNALHKSEIARVIESKNTEIALAQSETQRILSEKSDEITALKSSHSRELKDVCEAKDAEIVSAKRETEDLRIAKDAEISDLNALHKSEVARVVESKDAEIALAQSETQRILSEKYTEVRKLEKTVSALGKQLEDYRKTDIDALKDQLDSAMRGLLCRDEQLKKERAEFKERDEEKDTKITLLQREARDALDAKNVEIEMQKSMVKNISKQDAEKARVLSANAKEIAVLEFELRRARSKSLWKRIGCFVFGVFTLPVLVFLICVICN